ncbi:DUF1848 domain-containing protein [Desulfosporosinus sp. PR]|uniref:DUF1848 domain-containing protein n=1 Tax=Candidatus Desulfosporosinus nitrosoreducens TaxID=3401928 RepID=UPI0027F58CD2|nr:DUF1848 domain-containing protein [Desulfosporosinus sp. PR]MDQ7092131.1 DUF1848 domain-containing protein [Desulfosporosinus sp. PR]
MAAIIISASRRTDIPAFYSRWFINRIREGYCTVVNPFNRRQVTRVSLLPADVDLIVFWTKNAGPLIQHLQELDAGGFKYYFQYTVNGYPSPLEPYVPPLDTAIETFSRLAAEIGPDKVIWRYDPIVISNITGFDYHLQQFEKIARSLRGKTHRVVVSIVDDYRKSAHELEKLKNQDVLIAKEVNLQEIGNLMSSLSKFAEKNEMGIFSCAETVPLESYGISPGKCIDEQYIRQVLGLDIKKLKDKSQRPACGCILSKDIGVYDTCLYGCVYCYAGTLKSGLRNRQQHAADSPALIGW